MKIRYLFVGIILIAVLVAAVFIVKKFRPLTQPKISSAADAKAKGPVNAPIEIIEYSDFQCPACKMAQPVINEILILYPNKVRIVYRHFPLAGHQFAPMAHQAAECAAKQQKFWPMHDKLYADQEKWSLGAMNPSQSFLEYAQQNNLDLDAFALCLANADVANEILEEKQEGQTLLIKSTPTFFVNGKRFLGAKELKEQGIPFINEELKSQSS